MGRAFTVATIGVAATTAVVVVAGVLLLLLVGADTQEGGFASKNVSDAMEPTLLIGDLVTSRSLAGGKRLPELRRGDLVVYAWPADTSKQFIKRLIGLPGDTVSMQKGIVLINRRPLQESYVLRADPSADPVTSDFNWQRAYLVGPTLRDSAHYVASRDTWGPLVIPTGEYFVLGDNRGQSLDSRWWGFVPGDLLLGRVRRIYFSRDPTTHAVRWTRIGRRLQ